MDELINIEEDKLNYKENIIKLSRVAKVVKGGRRFSFSALVVVGDGKGLVGLGFGKANEVTDAITKAGKQARKSLERVYVTKNGTIPHEIIGKYKKSTVVMRPARPGTGIIAGGAVRSILEAAGYTDVFAKVYGSKNQMNVAKATMKTLRDLITLKSVAKRRDKEVSYFFN